MFWEYILKVGCAGVVLFWLAYLGGYGWAYGKVHGTKRGIKSMRKETDDGK